MILFSKLIFICSLALAFSPAQAGAKKKVCNELKVSQCKKRADCNWIKKSKKKDGSMTKAYCRKKPAKKK